jgi:hypothetical protein
MKNNQQKKPNMSTNSTSKFFDANEPFMKHDLHFFLNVFGGYGIFNYQNPYSFIICGKYLGKTI